MLAGEQVVSVARLDRACPIATGANMTRIIDKAIAADNSQSTSTSRPIRCMWTTSSLLALAACAAIAPSPADAQLATSPDVIRLPGITVTAPAPAPARPRPAPAAAADDADDDEPETAPRAAQQSSSPRASRRRPAASVPATASTAAAAPAQATRDASAVTVAPTGLTQSVGQTASAVTVIAAPEIEARQARNAPELLANVPGIQVVQTGGPGGLTGVFTRGTNSNHTKVFIDGIEMNSPVESNRAFDFGLLTTFDLGRVEVLRGPQSGLYGADALGGVVALYTRESNRPIEAEAVIEGGSFGTLNEAVGARGRVGAFRYSFNASHSTVDGFALVPERLIPAGGRQLEGQYENWTFASKVGVDVSPVVSFNVAARYTDSDYRFQINPGDARLSTTRSDQLYTRAETVVSLMGGRLKTVAGINYTGIDTDTIDATSSVSAAGFGERVKGDVRTVAEVMPGLVVTAGADWQNERLTQPTVGASGGFGVEEANVGGYLQASVEPVRNLFLTGNVRYDDNETFGEVTTWRLAPAAVIPDTGTTFRASFGTAYKAPSLSQRFQDFPGFGYFGNRDLRPEESRGMDVGFEQALFGGRARTGLTYFRNSITDLIELKSDFSTVENIGKARTSGIETFASADLSETLRIRGDYTYTEAINELTGKDLLRRPRHKASLAVGWQALPPLLVTTTLLYVGERLDGDRTNFDSTGNVVQPSFVTVNIAADYKLSENMSLIGRIDNLFDEQYEDPNGFLRPGLGAYAGVRIRN